MHGAGALQQNAIAVRRRLMNPANGRRSEETEVISAPELRRRRLAQASQFLEARKAQQDFDRQAAIEAAIRLALEEHARAKEIARRLLDDEPEPVSVAKIIGTVSRYYGLSTVDICSARKPAPVAFARQVAMYLGRELTLQSLPTISRLIGKRDHTTVIHGHRKIRHMVENDDRVAADVDNIKWELGIR